MENYEMKSIQSHTSIYTQQNKFRRNKENIENETQVQRFQTQQDDPHRAKLQILNQFQNDMNKCEKYRDLAESSENLSLDTKSTQRRKTLISLDRCRSVFNPAYQQPQRRNKTTQAQMSFHHPPDSNRKNSFNPKVCYAGPVSSKQGDKSNAKRKSQQSIRSYIYDLQEKQTLQSFSTEHCPVTVIIDDDLDEKPPSLPNTMVGSTIAQTPAAGSLVVKADHTRIFSNMHEKLNQSTHQSIETKTKTHRYTDSIHIISSGQVTSNETKSTWNQPFQSLARNQAPSDLKDEYPGKMKIRKLISVNDINDNSTQQSKYSASFSPSFKCQQTFKPNSINDNNIRNNISISDTDFEMIINNMKTYQQVVSS